MNGERASQLKVDPRRIPVVAERPSSEVHRRRAVALPLGWSAFAGLVGPAIVAFGLAVEPAPADPNAPEPLVATLLLIALLGAWGGAALLAVARDHRALAWAMGVAGLSLAAVIACPLTGHHMAVGGWWIQELAVCVAALAVAAFGRRVTSASIAA
jgi:hypothetical protein